MLLAYGATVDDQDERGWSALHFAAQDFHPLLAEVLLAAGANVHIKDVHGNAPLFTAVYNFQGKIELVEILLAAGADPKAKNKHGVSPLDLAQSIGNVDMSAVLMRFPGS